MESRELQIDLQQLTATASHWRVLGIEFGALTPPSPGQPYQPTTLAIVAAHRAISRCTAAFTTRTKATAGALEASTAGYVNNESTAAADLSGVPRNGVV